MTKDDEPWRMTALRKFSPAQIMIRCPHCQAEANLSKVIFSAKKKPYACPSGGEFSELPAWQPIVLILIFGLGLAAQLDQKQIDKFVGSGSGVFILSFLLAWLFLKSAVSHALGLSNRNSTVELESALDLWSATHPHKLSCLFSTGFRCSFLSFLFFSARPSKHDDANWAHSSGHIRHRLLDQILPLAYPRCGAATEVPR